jgi:hypothetical protein
MPKRFRELLNRPAKGYMTPPEQIKREEPGSAYSHAEVIGSPTEADKEEMKKQQEAEEMQIGFLKKMRNAKGGRKSRRKSKNRKTRRRH